MNIIPVIDLLNHQVVHAKRGDRANYLPIQSTLCPSSDPYDITRALLELYPFKQLYIADLAAIQGLGNHHEIIKELHHHFPGLAIWLDSGYKSVEEITSLDLAFIRPILGTESLPDLNAYLTIQNRLNYQGVLSLDFKTNGYQGPKELIEDSSHWPHDVIVMTLPSVGSNAGPDIATLKRFKRIAKDHNLYAAGGIRDKTDITALERLGINGALIASALHSGSLDLKAP